MVTSLYGTIIHVTSKKKNQGKNLRSEKFKSASKSDVSVDVWSELLLIPLEEGPELLPIPLDEGSEMLPCQSGTYERGLAFVLF